MSRAIVPTLGIPPTGSLPPVCIPSIVRAVFVAGLVLCGCNSSGPVEFRLNTEGRAPDEIGPAQHEAIVTAMEEMFGTPDLPEIPDEVPLDAGLVRRAAGPAGGNERGFQTGLFRQHCAGCHGISGDGAGDSAAPLDPYPRDFRNGLFKYTSTMAGAKPTRSDLRRTVRQGVPSTAMPSFARLPIDQIDALVEYVVYLAVRGEVELSVMEMVLDEGEYLPLETYLVREECVVPVVELWRSASQMVVDADEARLHAPAADTPRQWALSVAAGRKLYASADAQCVKCHGPDGRGDGEETELYDDWNKPKKGVNPQRTSELAGRFTLPIRRLQARDFRQGDFRGGSRPIDLYWRIHVGIKGTPMPAAGPSPGSPGVCTPEEIWHVVNYVRSLSPGR